MRGPFGALAGRWMYSIQPWSRRFPPWLLPSRCQCAWIAVNCLPVGSLTRAGTTKARALPASCGLGRLLSRRILPLVRASKDALPQYVQCHTTLRRNCQVLPPGKLHLHGQQCLTHALEPRACSSRQQAPTTKFCSTAGSAALQNGL